MNTLLQGPSRMVFYTDLRLVLSAFGGRHREFNWLITDLDCNWFPSEFQSGDPLWFTGHHLMTVVEQYDIQYTWAVCSAFPVHVSINPRQLIVTPYADGNHALWQPNVTIQHPEAQVEIVCWDGSATLLLSKDDDLTHQFRTFFPESVDLDSYNARHAFS